MTADVWATALSVLGPDGLDRLPDGVEAMIVVGTKSDHRTLCSPGLYALIHAEREGKDMLFRELVEADLEDRLAEKLGR
jgi:hypothetical protein